MTLTTRLNIGLTGGIGSGKSAVSALLGTTGAVIIDSDRLAREVVEPGTDGLAQVVAEFGPGMLDSAGRLDRPALAGIVFNDKAALAKLNAIVHPRVRARSTQLIEAAPAGAVLVHDIPLLTEGGLAPSFALVIVVETSRDTRLERLTTARNMKPEDVIARMAAQSSDSERRAVADVLLENDGTPAQLAEQVERVYADRLLPFAHNLVAGVPAPVFDRDVDPAARARLRARVEFALVAAAPVVRSKDGEVQVNVTGDLETAAEQLQPMGWVAVPEDESEDELRLRSADPGEATVLILHTRRS